MSAAHGADAVLWAMVALPAVTGGLLALSGGRPRPHRAGPAAPGTGRAAPVIALVTAAVTLGLALTAALTRPSVQAPFLAGGPLALSVDGLSALVVVTVATVSLLVLAFAAADVSVERPRFFGLMLLFTAAVLVTATATTLTGLLLAWEIMGAASYALIAFRWRENEPVAAGATAFLTTRVADLGLYLAAGAALAADSGAIPALSLGGLAALEGPWLHLAAAGALVTALGKAAQLPFSFWLSKAMLGPSPVSALLHSAAMVAMGGYLLLRLRPLLEAAGWAAPVAAWAGALTALGLGVVALAQRDLKQLLAASTSAQLGFVVLAAGTGSIAGGTAHFIAHAAVKSLLFLAAGAWVSALGTQHLPALRGAARRQRAVGAPFTVAALALAGVPPLSLWATKDEILAAVDSPALYGVALAAALLSALYAGKAIGFVLRPAPGRPHPGQREGRRARPLEAGPLMPLALGAAVLGLLALPPLSQWLKETVGAVAEPSATFSTMLATAVLALAGAASAALLAPRLPEPPWAHAWLHLEKGAHAAAVQPALALARLLARFDDAVLDRAVMAAAVAVRRLSSWCATSDRRGVDGLVRGIALGTRRLGDLARRPQTGQLHQYYAQAVALLVAAVALLLLLR
ncbi:proton-conducting transporter membrane subunit [Streptomyces gobiensis]|uniref:proton-conducting transporter transmembrane domain-containing protein n=1 Tax=Streptomyces gobiensis TaxID=2875706 RepID=UPI001E407CF9|nr:proton-conducting transporter membrane subunit [Streptomyces gobiensis]UGY93632.1 NADH-quinone oxidoreductase subunit L [Streptomyces gobiensis]